MVSHALNLSGCSAAGLCAIKKSSNLNSLVFKLTKRFQITNIGGWKVLKGVLIN